MKKTTIRLSAALFACMFLFTATVSFAANGVWNGTVDALWTNSANWSAAYPSGTDTASFTNSGSGQTLINLDGLISIRNITFDTPSVAAYTIGTSTIQTLVLGGTGVITLTDTAATSQVFQAGLQLGGDRSTGSYTINNLNTNQTLTFNNVFGGLTGGTAGGKTLSISGVGSTTILGGLDKGGATSMTLTDTSSGTVTVMGTNTFLNINMNGTGKLVLPGSNIVTTLNMGGMNSIVDIGDGYLFLNNGGSTVLTATQSGTINGTGTLRLSTIAGNPMADNQVSDGKTVVINVPIISDGGFEISGGGTGTFVLNATNTFLLDVLFNKNAAISVWKVGNKGSIDSNLGKGTNINFNADFNPGAKLIYTGTGEESDRTLIINRNAIIDHSGAGLLKFTAPLTASGNTKTLTLQGSTAGIGEIAGVIPVGSGTTTALAKNGTGTWILSAANTYAGTTTVNGGILTLTGTNGAINASTGYTINPGATLLLENASDANNTNRLRDASTVTLNGGTLCITNNGGAVTYRENAGTLAITSGGNSTIATTEASVGQTNTLTFTSLTYSGGKINFTGTGLGASDQNRIFIAGVTNGLMGAWATVNGTSYAAYSSTLGVYAFTGFTDIAAEGGVAESVIPNNGALLARINLPGVSGPITLQGERTNSIGQVLQNTTTNTTIATFDGVTNKLLRAAGLSIAEGKNELKVGVSENDGYLSPLTAGGTLVLENNSTGNALIVNSAIINNTSVSALSKIGAGTVVLNGTNTYSGTTSIIEGILTFGGNSAQTVLGTTTIANGTLAFAGNAVQTVAAAISGAGKVVKAGNSTLNLNTANTFTGGLTINQGSVATAQASGLGTGPVTNNSTLNLTGGALTYTGLSTSLSGSGTNNVTLSTDKTGSTVLNGNYSGFTGVWNIGIGGITSLTSRAQMTGTPQGVDNSAATINVLSNATLWAFGAGTHNAALILNGGDQGEPYGQLRIDTAEWAGPITLAGPITQATDGFIGSQNQDGIISGVIGEINGPYELSKVGNNKTTLTGANTYLGPTWVKAGAISVPALNSISGGASPLGAPTTATQGRIMLGNTTVAGTLIYTGTGNTSDRLIDLAGTTAGATLDQSGSGPLVLTGGMMISGTGAKTLTLQGSTAGTGEFAGAITNGAGSTISVTKAGTNTWTLSGINDYAGATTISAGTLNLTGSITNSAVTLSGGVLDVSGTVGNGNVIINGGTGTKVIARSAAALGTGSISFNTGATTPRLDLKIDGGNTIALPNAIGGNSTMTDTIDVDNNGTGTGGVIQFNGSACNFGSTVINVTGANGYSLFIANLRHTAGSSGTMVLNPTTAALGIGALSGNQASGTIAYTVQLDGTHKSNTITGTISDKSGSATTTIAITKTNSSTWTLTGTSTYTRPTTVNGGTLLVNAPGSLGASSAVTVNNSGILGGNGTINGTVTVNIGGRLAPGGIGTVDTINLSNTLTLNSGTLAFDISNVATDKVAVAGAIIVNNPTIVELTLAGGSLAEGTYTLMTYASKSGSGTFVLVPGYTNAILTAGDTSLTLTVGAGGTGTGNGMTWKGNASAIWNITDLNWDIDGVATNFTAGDLVTFDDSASAFTVGSSGTVLPSYVVFSNANTYTVSADIGGTAPLVKLGTGTTALTGLTTYNPASVMVNAGTLTLGGASQLNSGSYAGEMNSGGTLNFASSSVQTNSGTIAGVGSLIQSGSGTLTLSGSNSFSGTVTVNAGSQLTVLNRFALGATTVGTTVASGGTLEVAGDVATLAEALSLAGTLSSQTGSNTYAGVVTVQAGSPSFDIATGSIVILTDKIAGSAPFTKVGGGTLRLALDPNNTGTMTINGGVVEITNGTTDGDIVINSGGTFLASIGGVANDSKSITVNAGGVYDFRGADTIASLNGDGLMTKGTPGLSSFTVGNGSGSFSGVIENGIGIIAFYKSGTGVQTLAGANTYTGVTAVTVGTLLIDGSTATNSAVTANNATLLGGTGTIYGPVNMASGSTLLPGGPNAIGTLTLANDSATSLTLNGSTLRYDIANVAGNVDLVDISGASGNVVLNGINIIQLNFLNGSSPVGDYTLMTFNSYTGSGSFALASSYANATLELTANSLVLHVVGGSASAGLSWKGNISGIWDGGILNWTNGMASVAYTPGAAATFDDTASGNFTVSSGGAVSPASLFFNNSGNAYTISANVSGTGPLVKLGTGALTLSGLTTYNPESIMLSPSTVTLSGASQLNSGNYAGNINNNATLTTLSSADQTLIGVLSGVGSLVKDSASTMTLSGTNTYTGATTVRGGGTLKIMNNTALGTTAGGTTVTNATLELAGDITTPAEALDLYGTLACQTGTNTYAGVVSLRTGSSVDVGLNSLLILTANTPNIGTQPFSKTGAGTLRLTVDPNHRGVCTVAAGTLELNAGTTDDAFIINSGATLRETAAALGDFRITANGTFDIRANDQIGGLDGSGFVTIGNTTAYTLTVGGGNQSGSFSGVMQNGTGTLGFTKVGTGTQTLSGVNTFSGNMSIAGTLLLTGAGQFRSGLYAGTIANTGMFVHDSSANQTLDGVISGSGGQLRKTGTGTLTLSKVNTYNGATAISNGVLRGVVGGSCASSAVTLAAATGKSATLEVGVTDITKQWTCNSLTVNNAGVSSGLSIDFGYLQPSTNVPPLKITGALTLTTAPVLTIKSGSLPVTTGNGYPLMTWGSGSAATITTVILPGHLTGSVVVIGTTNYLQITANNQPLLWATSGAGTWNTSTANWQDLVGASTAYSEVTLPGDQVVFSDSNLVADTTVTLNTIVTPARVTVTNDAYSYTISGSGGITGPIGLTKLGTNTLTLGTANTFTGLTALNNGTLKLANATALPAGNNLAMAGKGTLDMNGNATALTNITASTAANTITDSSAGAGTTALSIRNQATTIAATIKDGASKSVAVSIANNNASISSFSTTSSNTYSGGLVLKNGASLGSGTRLRIMTPMTTDGKSGNIISSPFGTGPITIGEAAGDKAGILLDTVGTNNIVNDLIVNTTNGTDVIFALRMDTVGHTLSGKVTANSDLTFGGGGTTGGSIALTNEVSGPGGVRLVSAGTALTVSLFGPNTYKGKTTLPSGSTLAFNSIGNVGSGPSALGAPDDVASGTITVGNGTTIGMTLLYRGMGHTTDRVLELAGTSGGLTINHSGTNLLKFTSDLLMSGNGAKRLQLTGANNSTGEVAGVISDNAGGKLDLYKASTTSTWILSGTNTFTDTVNINAGKLIIKNSLALGLGNKTVVINQGSSGNPQLYLDGSDGPITLGTNFTFQTSNNNSGSLHNTKGTNTIEGNIIMTGGGGDTIITSWADKLYISGQVTPNTSVRNLHLRGNGDGEISGIIANGATTNMPVLKDSGTGTWTLSGSNTYSGTTTISSGTLAVGSDQAFGVSNIVSLAGGNLGSAVGTWSITNTVNVQNNAAINTLGTLILTGAITNNAGLTKTGDGTLLLNGSKTGTGALTVSAGVLGGNGTIAGTVTNLATITAADTNSIGTLTVANLDMASNSTLFWNCNAVTQDVINVAGTLTLPTVATVIVDEDTVGDLGVAPRVLFTFTTGPAPTLLSNWVIVGAPQGTVARVSNNQVYLFRTGGTMISIF